MQTVGLSNIQKELLKLYANNVSDHTLLVELKWKKKLNGWEIVVN